MKDIVKHLMLFTLSAGLLCVNVLLWLHPVTNVIRL